MNNYLTSFSKVSYCTMLGVQRCCVYNVYKVYTILSVQLCVVYSKCNIRRMLGVQRLMCTMVWIRTSWVYSLRTKRYVYNL